MSDRLVRLALYALAAVVIAAALAFSLNRLTAWLPWSAESRLERSEQARDHAERDALARSLESQGQSDQLARVETYHTHTTEVRTITADAVDQARSAPDASTPLDPARADRLRAHDRLLCELSPLSGCPAAPDAAD